MSAFKISTTSDVGIMKIMLLLILLILIRMNGKIVTKLSNCHL